MTPGWVRSVGPNEPAGLSAPSFSPGACPLLLLARGRVLRTRHQAWSPCILTVPPSLARIAASRERIPMGRAASDEEVAGLIAFLCSPAAALMTGQSINIDGGMVMW
jgi:NAD(P)-dependent dehydrogenase (short-subunit alcohol dehydrogenase family)